MHVSVRRSALKAAILGLRSGASREERANGRKALERYEEKVVEEEEEEEKLTGSAFLAKWAAEAAKAAVEEGEEEEEEEGDEKEEEEHEEEEEEGEEEVPARDKKRKKSANIRVNALEDLKMELGAIEQVQLVVGNKRARKVTRANAEQRLSKLRPRTEVESDIKSLKKVLSHITHRKRLQDMRPPTTIKGVGDLEVGDAYIERTADETILLVSMFHPEYETVFTWAVVLKRKRPRYGAPWLGPVQEFTHMFEKPYSEWGGMHTRYDNKDVFSGKLKVPSAQQIEAAAKEFDAVASYDVFAEFLRRPDKQ